MPRDGRIRAFHPGIFADMRIFLLTGVVTALSPGVPKADRVTFDFVEITKTAGMRIRLENISVSTQVAKIFEVDSIGSLASFQPFQPPRSAAVFLIP